MATKDAACKTALLARLASLALSPAVPVAWPGFAFTVPPGPYLKVEGRRNTNIRTIIADDGEDTLRGVFQITLMHPKPGGNVDTTAITEIGGKIADHFNKGTRLQVLSGELRIDQRPTVEDPMPTDTRIEVPVSIYWQANL